MTAPRSSLVDFDQLLLLIGRLNYSWTNTESLLIHMVAGLSGTDKETATIIFLTLNTTRARVDLVERLAKRDRRNQTEKERVLEATGGARLGTRARREQPVKRERAEAALAAGGGGGGDGAAEAAAEKAARKAERKAARREQREAATAAAAEEAAAAEKRARKEARRAAREAARG